MQKSLRKGGLRPLAFTLIELMLVIIIMAVLSMALLLTVQRGVLKATFDDQVVEITAMIEKARGYALSNYLVNDTEPAQYYRLYIQTSKIRLIANGETDSETLETLSYESGFSMDSSTSVYYFPPNGDICFNTGCTGSTTSKTFTFRDTNSTYQTQFTITKYGGYPEIEEL